MSSSVSLSRGSVASIAIVSSSMPRKLRHVVGPLTLEGLTGALKESQRKSMVRTMLAHVGYPDAPAVRSISLERGCCWNCSPGGRMMWETGV